MIHMGDQMAFLNLRGDLRLVLYVRWLVLHVLWLVFHVLGLVLHVLLLVLQVLWLVLHVLSLVLRVLYPSLSRPISYLSLRGLARHLHGERSYLLRYLLR